MKLTLTRRQIWSDVIPLNANSLSERKGDLRSRKIARFGLVIPLFIALNIGLLKDYSVAKENYKPTHYKQYILIELNNFEQAYCLIELYHNESRFNPAARNGSHYGIPQGRSVYLSKVDGTKQIDWGIKYNLNRYGSMCKALEHYKIKGWH